MGKHRNSSKIQCSIFPRPSPAPAHWDSSITIIPPRKPLASPTSPFCKLVRRLFSYAQHGVPLDGDSKACLLSITSRGLFFQCSVKWYDLPHCLWLLHPDTCISLQPWSSPLRNVHPSCGSPYDGLWPLLRPSGQCHPQFHRIGNNQAEGERKGSGWNKSGFLLFPTRPAPKRERGSIIWSSLCDILFLWWLQLHDCLSHCPSLKHSIQEYDNIHIYRIPGCKIVWSSDWDV